MWAQTILDSYFLQPTASNKGWKLCNNPYLYEIAIFCYHWYRNVQNQITRFYFRLKNNILWLLLNYSGWHFRQFSNVLSVCIRNQSSEDRTSVVSLAFWLVLPFRERRILYGSSKKKYNFVVFIYFNTSNYVLILQSLYLLGFYCTCQTKSLPLPVGFCQKVKDNE